ncbi:MAG: hypothetical protein O2887_09575 [Bacteroidetes bacterium]|nr:hypothetical protein [Bacteroidota bacterium]MDA1120720.1 hypothetical protein [Bacteroidota bacterium]
MKKVAITLLLFVFYFNSNAQIPDPAIQIAAAIQAAPEEIRVGAMVYGYDADGNLVTLQKGSNDLICLADDPNKSGFNAACYHKDLEEFMARGRELRAQGKTPSEIFDAREEEAKSGKLKMPDHPATLHILSGSDGMYNPETGVVDNAFLRYVVYIPFATSASSGLPTKPTGPGHPWIMDPGTHRAHIMISPPKE